MEAEFVTLEAKHSGAYSCREGVGAKSHNEAAWRRRTDEDPDAIVVIVTELAWVLIAFASTVVAANVAVVLVLRSIYKRIRRNRAVNGAALRVRSQLNWGSRREVLKLRLRLRETLGSGQAAIDLVVRSDGLRGELPRLFRRLENEGDALDAQLRLLESENDPAVLAEILPTVRHRVDHVAYIVHRLRSAVGSVLGGPSDDSLTTLRSDIDREIVAVRAGVQELHELNEQGVLNESRRPPATDHLTRE